MFVILFTNFLNVSVQNVFLFEMVYKNPSFIIINHCKCEFAMHTN